MVELVSASIPQETLLVSDLLAGVVVFYCLLFLPIYISFVRICEIDEHEFKNDLQTTFFKFKRKIPFIFSESGSKTVFSKKPFVLQIIGYIISLVVLAIFIVSLFINVDAALLLLVFSAFIVFSYGIVIAVMRDKVLKRGKNWANRAAHRTKLTEEEKTFLVQFKQKNHPRMYDDDNTEGALFLETVDFEVCPFLLRGEVVNDRTRMSIMEDYRLFLESADQTAFDEYAKEYFEDIRTVMDIFEKHHSK